MLLHVVLLFFFFKTKTGSGFFALLVGSEMFIRDRASLLHLARAPFPGLGTCTWAQSINFSVCGSPPPPHISGGGGPVFLIHHHPHGKAIILGGPSLFKIKKHHLFPRYHPPIWSLTLSFRAAIQSTRHQYACCLSVTSPTHAA